MITLFLFGLLGFLFSYPLRKAKGVFTTRQALGFSVLPAIICFLFLIILLLPTDPNVGRHAGSHTAFFAIAFYTTLKAEQKTIDWIQKKHLIYWSIVGGILIYIAITLLVNLFPESFLLSHETLKGLRLNNG